MYKRILFPTDGSDITAKALQSALGLAKLCGAEIQALAVMEPFPYSAISEMQPVPPQEFFDAQLRVAQARIKIVTDAAAAAGVTGMETAAEVQKASKIAKKIAASYQPPKA